MENIAATFEIMVNSFTDADELMNFAATWGIQGAVPTISVKEPTKWRELRK
jgi:hypothetical protein